MRGHEADRQGTADAVRDPVHTGPPVPAAPPQRYGRYVVLLAIVILVLITVNTIVTKPNGLTGIPPGEQFAPFAAPLVQSDLVGAVDVAHGRDEGGAGRVPACALRGPRILNVCQLYERAPVVLALFIDAGSCAGVLQDMQGLVRSFPDVRFAAVSLKGDRSQLRRLVRRDGLTFPVAIDETGRLAALYRVATCPQVSFAYPGGTVQSRALLTRPSAAELRARVAALVSAARARGWRPAAG
jgi:hypothetical protein